MIYDSKVGKVKLYFKLFENLSIFCLPYSDLLSLVVNN